MKNSIMTLLASIFLLTTFFFWRQAHEEKRRHDIDNQGWRAEVNSIKYCFGPMIDFLGSENIPKDPIPRNVTVSHALPTGAYIITDKFEQYGHTIYSILGAHGKHYFTTKLPKEAEERGQLSVRLSMVDASYPEPTYLPKDQLANLDLVYDYSTKMGEVLYSDKDFARLSVMTPEEIVVEAKRIGLSADELTKEQGFLNDLKLIRKKWGR